MVWRWLNLFVLKPIRMIYIKDIIGLENLSIEPPFIVFSNHSSYIDPFIINSILFNIYNKKTHFLADTRNFGHKLGDFIFTGYAGCIPIDLPKKELFLRIKNLLDNKEIIGIFPEGDRSLDGKIQPFRRGIGKMVLDSAVPIIPISLKGTGQIWHPKKRWPRLKKCAILNIGKPIIIDNKNKNPDDVVEQKKIAELLRKRIIELHQ